MSDDDYGEFNIEPGDFDGDEALAHIAKMGMSVYRTTKRDGATEAEAFTVTAAFFAGMTKAMYEEDGR